MKECVYCRDKILDKIKMIASVFKINQAGGLDTRKKISNGGFVSMVKSEYVLDAAATEGDNIGDVGADAVTYFDGYKVAAKR